MFQRIPSPSALRTFEAAARLRSFKKAAGELGVTPTAVSHQIRALEEMLGIALFVRRTRAIDLTEAGAVLAPAVHSGFLEIKTALEEIGTFENILTVTTTAAFAALCLVPKLAEFKARHPDISIQLYTGSRPVDLRRDHRIDIAIRYGLGPYPGFHEVRLIEEWFGAYCAPDYLEKIQTPPVEGLLETAWQQSVLENITWVAWIRAAGLKIPESGLKIQRFDEEQFVLQAAIAGQGLVLSSSILVDDFVDRGLLVPYRRDIRLAGAGYTAICRKNQSGSPRVRHFLNWLSKEFFQQQ